MKNIIAIASLALAVSCHGAYSRNTVWGNIDPDDNLGTVLDGAGAVSSNQLNHCVIKSGDNTVPLDWTLRNSVGSQYIIHWTGTVGWIFEGTAAIAAKAYRDEHGNYIHETYASKDWVSSATTNDAPVLTAQILGAVEREGGVSSNSAVRISATQITNDVASWAMNGSVRPITEHQSLAPATNYTDAVAAGYLPLTMTNSFAQGILTQSGRDCGAKIADATNAVTKVLTISTNGVAAASYNGTAEVSLDITAGGGGVDPEQVKTIISEVFPSNRVFGVDGGLLTAYDVSADGARTNEIWREARGYALTNGVERGGLIGVVNPAIDGTITTITIGDETMAAAGVSVDLPSAWDSEARDFAVYVFNGAAVAAPLRLPTNATIYGYYASATNALKANAATALYFTEISRNTFLLGRAELTKVQEAAQ